MLVQYSESFGANDGKGGVGPADLGEDATQGVLLSGRMSSPVLRV